MKTRFVQMACAVALLASATAAHANLVVNGNFETGNFNGWTKSGNTALSDVISNTVTSNHSYVWRSGATGSPALITQLLATTAGASYTLEFDVYNTATQNAAFEVFFDGASVFSFANTPYNWAHLTFNGLAASTGSTALTFSARNDPSFIRLDNVVVNADSASHSVPEPSSTALALLAVGLALVAMRRSAKTSTINREARRQF